jgi:hypothetical protein
MLTVKDRRKLLSCLALLLSDKDGEALAAGRAAGRLLGSGANFIGTKGWSAAVITLLRC